MIFKHGFVHCDAHPGNMMVRRNPDRPNEPQLVLLDHGFYCTMKDDFRKNFCDLFIALTSFDNQTVLNIANKMKMGDYARHLPVIFTFRSINSKKKLGEQITKEEIKFFKGYDEFNFDKVSFLF